MKTSEEIYNILKDKFGDSITKFVTDVPKEQVIEVSPLEIDKICLFLRDTEDLDFDNLILLTGLDDENGVKTTNADGGFDIAGGTLSVVYHLESMKLRHSIVLRTFAARENPEVNSIALIWRCADWHEREAFDMFGIVFLNHPDLRRILMPYDWEAGYPLRKDYRNPEFYMGMKVPY
jgi:NADH-quinone oxidoreductase subunit C